MKRYRAERTAMPRLKKRPIEVVNFWRFKIWKVGSYPNRSTWLIR